MMAAEKELYACLGDIFSGSPGFAVIHSSLPNLMPPRSVTPSAMVSFFEKAVNKGWTLAFPAFTFSFCHGTPFDLLRSPSETGQLADWALSLVPGAVRMRHPVYSYVIVGPGREYLLDTSSRDCFGAGSIFERFEEKDALQVMFGCGSEYCTQCHRYEELFRVPYRSHVTFRGMADWRDGNGPVEAETVLFVRDPDLDVQYSWRPVFSKLEAAGLLERRRLWRGRVEVATTLDIMNAATQVLSENRLGFLLEPETADY